MKLTWRENHAPGGDRHGWIAEFPGGVATIDTNRDWRKAIDGAATPGSFNDADLHLTVSRHGEKNEAMSAAFVRGRKPVGGVTAEGAMVAVAEYLKRQVETRYLLDPPPHAEDDPPAVGVRYEVFVSPETASEVATGLAAEGWVPDGSAVPVVIETSWRFLQRFVRRV